MKKEVKFLDHFSFELNDRKHIFVFGSNLAGRHGKGAALTARKYWGAEYGIGFGRTGYSFAIPTKDEKLKILSLYKIKEYIDHLNKVIIVHPDLTFLVTPIGTGLAGYKHSDIAPMFKGFPDNCIFCTEWRKYLI